jgi:hypothetical protein
LRGRQHVDEPEVRYDDLADAVRAESTAIEALAIGLTASTSSSASQLKKGHPTANL